MKTLSELQTLAGRFGRLDNLVITSGTGLATAMAVYRRTCLFLPWPELRVRDTSMSTTDASTDAGASTMDWPNAPTFLDLRIVEVQDGDDQNRYKAVVPAEDELSFQQLSHRPPVAVPGMYAKYRDPSSDTLKVEFRPAFKYTGKTIRRTGIITPPELDTGDDQTVFESPAADDALAHMIAATELDVDGFVQHADKELGKASSILSSLFGRDVPPEELGRIINRS